MSDCQYMVAENGTTHVNDTAQCTDGVWSVDDFRVRLHILHDAAGHHDHVLRDVLAIAADFDRAPDSGASPPRAPAGAPADDERTIDLRRCISALCSAFAARSAAFMSTLRACVKKSFAVLFEMFSMRYVLPAGEKCDLDGGNVMEGERTSLVGP